MVETRAAGGETVNVRRLDDRITIAAQLVAETDVVFTGANNKEQNKSPSKLSGRATFTSERSMITVSYTSFAIA